MEHGTVEQAFVSFIANRVSDGDGLSEARVRTTGKFGLARLIARACLVDVLTWTRRSRGTRIRKKGCPGEATATGVHRQDGSL